MEILDDLQERLTSAGVRPAPIESRTACSVPGCSGNHPPCITEHGVDVVNTHRQYVVHDLDRCGKPGGCGLTAATVDKFPV